MARRIQLTPAFQVEYFPGVSTGYRLVIEVSNTEDLNADDNIFIHTIEISDLTQDPVEMTTRFAGVCTWPQYVNVPIGPPAMMVEGEKFRTNKLDVVFNTVEAAEAFWLTIQTAVVQLLRDMAAGDNLETTGAIWLTE